MRQIGAAGPPPRALNAGIRYLELAPKGKGGCSCFSEVSDRLEQCFGKITMVTAYGMHPSAHTGTRWEAGAIVQVRDDYRAAKDQSFPS